jgi:hypothetical protein
MASFSHPVLQTVQGEPDYQTIRATRKFLQANSRAIDTHLGGGTLGHLGLIISDASYAMISPTSFLVFGKRESVRPSKQCRYDVPTERNFRPTFDDEKDENEEYH